MMETDAHRIEEYSAPLTVYRRMCELARTLERERDEALELIDAVTPEIDAAYMTDLCCTLRSERDEAREQRDRLAEAIRKHKDAFPFALDFCDVELYEALQSLTHNAFVEAPPTQDSNEAKK